MRALRIASLVALVACGAPPPPSGALTDDDIERVCGLAERCGGGLAMPGCIAYYEAVRDGAAIRGCSDSLANELRCFVDAGACGPTPGCEAATHTYETCASSTTADTGPRDAARDVP